MLSSGVGVRADGAGGGGDALGSGVPEGLAVVALCGRGGGEVW